MVDPRRQQRSSRESEVKGRPPLLPRWLVTTLVLVAAAILVFVVFRALGAYEFIILFDDGVEVLAGQYGLNIWLARALVAVFFAPLAWGAKRGFFTVGKQTFRTKLLTGAYASLYFFGMYFVARNASFHHTTGEVLQWYAETPEGVRFFDSPGYDPKYGVKLAPVTPELRSALERRRRGDVPSPVAISQFAALQLFDPLTGTPRYWYYQSPTGEFELFDGPGFHPQNQQVLQPIGAAVVVEIRRSLENKRAATEEASRIAFVNRYIDPSTVRASGGRRWAVAITDSANASVPSLQAVAEEALSQRGIASVWPFRQPFFTEGLNRRINEGDVATVRSLSLRRCCEVVLLGSVDVGFTTSPEHQGLVTARMSVRLRVVSTENGRIMGQGDIQVVGAGFSVAAANSQALERVAAGLRQRLAELAR